ncbi:hypothetical protein A2U01_0016125 [Trifolium medium]|uniref:Uncharacterized protein n=1 Tax=Trifolium medium TaxID=97028 RepID=A0A392N5Y0_9FABA|nr:hypothetical protein [Trifolium medium]
MYRWTAGHNNAALTAEGRSTTMSMSCATVEVEMKEGIWYGGGVTELGRRSGLLRLWNLG